MFSAVIHRCVNKRVSCDFAHIKRPTVEIIFVNLSASASWTSHRYHRVVSAIVNFLEQRVAVVIQTGVQNLLRIVDRRVDERVVGGFTLIERPTVEIIFVYLCRETNCRNRICKQNVCALACLPLVHNRKRNFPLS